MDLQNGITRVFYEEHVASRALMEKIQTLLGKYKDGVAPTMDDTDAIAVLREATYVIKGELREHFAFEEDELFPRLAEEGDGAICQVLTEEHEEITPLGERLVIAIQAGLKDGFTDTGWTELRTLAQDFTDRLISHIDKEQMGLVMALDGLIDEVDDARMMAEYAVRR